MDPRPGPAAWWQSTSRAQAPSRGLVLPGGLPASPQRLRSRDVAARCRRGAGSDGPAGRPCQEEDRGASQGRAELPQDQEGAGAG